MEFLHCVIYLAAVGAAAFVVGRLLPCGWPDPNRGWWRSFPAEREGRIYEKLHIRRWQKRVPDMSRILPRFIPAKKLEGRDLQRLPEMIRETCVAELIHLLLCLAGLHCLRIWRGVGGVAAVQTLEAHGSGCAGCTDCSKRRRHCHGFVFIFHKIL